MEKDTTPYYGQNDFRPWGCFKVSLIVLGCILLSFLLIPLCLLFTIMICCTKLNPNQVATLKILKFFEPWYKCPGMRMEVRSTGPDTSDIIIAKEFVDERRILHTCGGMGLSLRKSVECTVDTHIRKGPHAAALAADTDVDKPRLHLHGRLWPYDPASPGDECWTSGARCCQWPAMYAWSGRLPEGMSCGAFTQQIDVATAPQVFGYIVLFEVSNPNFYAGESRITRLGSGATNAPDHTPETEGKIFARYNFYDSYTFGNLRTDGSEPDAYIFKGKTLRDAEMKVLHTYRLVKPELSAAPGAGVECQSLLK